MPVKPVYISTKDRVFQEAKSGDAPFRFTDEVADAFDDMARRSIPGYQSSLKTIEWLAETQVAPLFSTGTVFDLGASLGAVESKLLPQLAKTDWKIVAVDLSSEMLARAEERLREEPHADRIEWRCEDVATTVFEDAILVVSNYCLQFVAPDERRSILKRIYDALRPGAFLVLSEKTLGAPKEEALFVSRYDAFKRENGYSEEEIERKRKALVGVLQPWSLQENETALDDAGFKDVWLITKHWNFCTWIAQK